MPCQYASYAQMALHFDGLTFLPLDCDIRAFLLTDLVTHCAVLALLEYVFIAN